MHASGVNFAIMRVIGKLEQKKMHAIRIACIWVVRITGFHCKINYCILYNPNTRIHRKTANSARLEQGGLIPSSLVQINKEITSLRNAS